MTSLWQLTDVTITCTTLSSRASKGSFPQKNEHHRISKISCKWAHHSHCYIWGMANTGVVQLERSTTTFLLEYSSRNDNGHMHYGLLARVRMRTKRTIFCDHQWSHIINTLSAQEKPHTTPFFIWKSLATKRTENCKDYVFHDQWWSWSIYCTIIYTPGVYTPCSVSTPPVINPHRVLHSSRGQEMMLTAE